jgi:hypothetical protein
MAGKRGMKTGSVCYSPAEARILRQFDQRIQKITGDWKPVHRKLSRGPRPASSASRPVSAAKTGRKKKSNVVTITDADLGLKASKPSKKEKAMAAELAKKSVVTEKDLTRAEAMGLMGMPGSREAKKAAIGKKLSKKQKAALASTPGIGSVPGPTAAKEAYATEQLLSQLEKEVSNID